MKKLGFFGALLVLPLFLWGQTAKFPVSVGKSKLVDNSGRVATIDPVSYAQNFIDYAHHEIHTGDHYFIEDYVTLASGDSAMFIVTVPDTAKWTHLVVSHKSSAGGYYFDVYEGVTATGGTTYSKTFNNNRNSSNTSVLEIMKDATVTDKGTQIIRNSFGSSTGAASMSGSDTRDHELILKQNTKYVFVFKSKANANDITFDAHWYEHTNKE